MGEIVKLQFIDHKLPAPGEITRDNISEYIYEALKFKRYFCQVDEFDKGSRNLLNYGHCIGHGIESATNFAIPHGIAVAMGMDVANKFAHLSGRILDEKYDAMHKTLFDIYKSYCDVYIDTEKVCKALTKDKKNTGSKISLILPESLAVEKQSFEPTNTFWLQIHNALAQVPIRTRS